MSSNLNFLFAVLAGLVLISLAMLSRSCEAPDVPRYFDRKMSLEDARARAAELDRPLLMVFVDAGKDSTRMKKGPLGSARVSKWISDHAVPVLLDVRNAATGDMEARLLVSRNQIEGYPTLILTKDGQELARETGFLSRRDLATWLESAGGKSSAR
jgi:hypothetical protein